MPGGMPGGIPPAAGIPPAEGTLAPELPVAPTPGMLAPVFLSPVGAVLPVVEEALAAVVDAAVPAEVPLLVAAVAAVGFT